MLEQLNIIARLLNVAYAELLRDNPDLDTILGHIAEAKAIAEGE
jgi:hypothetical protein